MAAKHQSVLHFVEDAPWSDAWRLARVGQLVLPAIERSGRLKPGSLVTRAFPRGAAFGRSDPAILQSAWQADKCQVAVSLSLANHDASLLIAYRLYLPEDWAKDQAPPDKARVPETIAFQTKPAIALSRSRWPARRGAPRGWCSMDAGYGNNAALRTDITAFGLRYVAGIVQHLGMAAGEAPMPPQSRTGRGRPQMRLQRGQHRPISVKTLALSLPQEAWQTITWREGTADRLSSRFTRRRARPSHRGQLAERAARHEWLLIECRSDEPKPTWRL